MTGMRRGSRNILFFVAALALNGGLIVAVEEKDTGAAPRS